jgi:hypothetical protein
MNSNETTTDNEGAKMSNDTPKSTPGPWEVFGNKVCDENGFPVAKVGWLTQSDDEALANATLMAKAPAFYADEKDKIVHLKTLKAQVLSLKEKVPMPLCTPDFIARYIDEIIEDTEKLLAGARGEMQNELADQRGDNLRY